MLTIVTLASYGSMLTCSKSNQCILWVHLSQQCPKWVNTNTTSTYFVWDKIRSLRWGAIGRAAVAVAPRTERNHTADASPTLIPLLFKTLKYNSSETLEANCYSCKPRYLNNISLLERCKWDLVHFFIEMIYFNP